MKKIVIWDSAESICKFDSDWLVVLWNGHSEESNKLSISHYIEAHADQLRKEYLSWIYDLAERQYLNKRIVDWFQIRPNLSAWWTTLINESPNILIMHELNDVIKILALNRILEEAESYQVILISSNSELAETLSSWASNIPHSFKWQKAMNTNRKDETIARKLYKKLPIPIKTLAWLFRYCIISIPLVGAGVREWKASKAETGFVSYLSNLLQEATKEGIYATHYWGDLPDMLREHRLLTRWLHLWSKSPIALTAKEARTLIDSFNQNPKNFQVHAVIESFLGTKTVFRALTDWIYLMYVGKRLEKIFAEPTLNPINPWPLIRHYWLQSIFGVNGLQSMLNTSLFDAAFQAAPKLNKGFYLQENQAWELCCISAWQRRDNKTLIGVIHSSVRYWDLRYFHDPRVYEQKYKCDLPMPDLVAVNGPIAKKAYLDGGYPKLQVIEVEALRYSHLLDIEHKRRICSLSGTHNTLLVLTDYLIEDAFRQLEVLERCAPRLNNWKIAVKPHPCCKPFGLEHYPCLSGNGAYVSHETLENLLYHFSIVFCGQSSTAALEAYAVGLAVVSFLDPKTLNLNPLRGINGITFVSTSNDLANALHSPSTSAVKYSNNVFYTDLELTKWKKLIF